MDMPINEYLPSILIELFLVSLCLLLMTKSGLKKIYIDIKASKRVNKKRNLKRKQPLTDFEKYLRQRIIVDGDKWIIN